MKYVDIDRIYQNVPLDKIPWNSKTPPDALVKLVQGGKVRPCRTIDLGCGAGNYAIYLPGLGFEVTGVDSSPTAIKIAGENAKKRESGAGLLSLIVFIPLDMGAGLILAWLHLKSGVSGWGSSFMGSGTFSSSSSTPCWPKKHRGEI
jgi:SAM-dependent methyltransferase